MFLKGDLVRLVGSHDIGPEVTALLGTVIGPWADLDEWWEIMTERGEIISWPENQMLFLERGD